MNPKVILQCACHDYHFVVFEWFPEDKWSDVDIEAYVNVGGDIWDTWKRRFRIIWRVLTGKHCSVFDMVLDLNSAIELRNSLNGYIMAADQQRARRADVLQGTAPEDPASADM